MLSIVLREHDTTPVYLQIVNAVRHEIAEGTLKSGDSIPSVRELSGYLGINVNTVNRAYQELKQSGLIVIRPARGARISPDVERILGSSKNKNKLESEVKTLLMEAHRLGFGPRDVTEIVARLANQK